MPLAFNSLSLRSAVAACFGFASSFVLSLYLGDVRLPRDHPVTVKRRILAVSLLTVFSPLCLLLLADNSSLDLVGLLQTMGLRLDGLIHASIYSVGLVSLLYLGPILQRVTEYSSEEEGLISYLRAERTDLLLRNYLIAPVAEEVVFRSCMVPLLLPHLGPSWTIILCPLFFGVAHLHHMLEHLKAGTFTLSQALFNVLIQTTYTSLFGMFSAHLFLQTGHLTSAIAAHIMCNILGLPEVTGLPNHKYRLLVVPAYIAGFLCFMYCIYLGVR